MHSVVGAAANVADVTQVDRLLHGEENLVCTGGLHRSEAFRAQRASQIVAQCSIHKRLNKPAHLIQRQTQDREGQSAGMGRAKHHFRVVKRQPASEGA